MWLPDVKTQKMEAFNYDRFCFQFARRKENIFCIYQEAKGGQPVSTLEINYSFKWSNCNEISEGNAIKPKNSQRNKEDVVRQSLWEKYSLPPPAARQGFIPCGSQTWQIKLPKLKNKMLRSLTKHAPTARIQWCSCKNMFIFALRRSIKVVGETHVHSFVDLTRPCGRGWAPQEKRQSWAQMLRLATWDEHEQEHALPFYLHFSENTSNSWG